MIKTKVIYCNVKSLEENLNLFFFENSNINIIDIKYSSEGNDSNDGSSVIIFYKEYKTEI